MDQDLTSATVVDHPMRAVLNDEVHARPSLAIRTPARITHVAQLTGEFTGGRTHLAELCRELGVPEPPLRARHVQVTVQGRRLKWERHTEFTTIMVVDALEDGQVLGDRWSALTPLLEDWVARLPGERLSAVHVRLERDGEPHLGPEELSALLPSGDVVGSVVGGGDALVFTDFRIGPDGHVRMLVRDKGLSVSRAGRLVQRLCEVDSYRMMALLGLVPARESGPELARMEARLGEIVAQTAAGGRSDPAEDHQLLDSLTRLAAEAEALSSRCRYRFSATTAYAGLVERRIEELREERIPGLQRVGYFLDRRFRPAVRTCEAVARRQQDLADGIARASGLLRTRVDVHRAEQNVEILRSLEARTAAQVRLQEAVEGLSVFAISYYALGLLKYVLDGLPKLGLPFPKELLAAIAAPVIVLAVWFGVRRVRKALKEGKE